MSQFPIVISFLAGASMTSEQVADLKTKHAAVGTALDAVSADVAAQEAAQTAFAKDLPALKDAQNQFDSALAAVS
jgi:hypothetical protein